ncbi:MAG: hypothetical protein MMC33_003564 [Icmadophila ericetorum]|nr:hypothetical protein [Icmadophila ericetorum]
MAVKLLATDVDVAIVGNGPSALILSFILHGNIPYYDPANPHPDPILHAKLLKSPCLLDIDVLDLTAHFTASRLSYSTQALPVNVLLDTLIRPLADTEPGSFRSCVRWRHEPHQAVSHIVLGNTTQAGGQWADNPVAASWDIKALSYAEMLSLPGYSIEDHFKATRNQVLEDFHRPTRREVANYLAAYPLAVGIDSTIWLSRPVESIIRTSNGFHLLPENIYCKHLALASGIFSQLVPARPQLQPLLRLPHSPSTTDAPLLVVGSGFTAADIIIANLPKRKIIHIFRWAPEDRPSPLRACHPRAYPEYAGVYRRMKLSALKRLGKNSIMSPLKKSKANLFFNPQDWDDVYEGMPNTYIKGVSVHGNTATVTFEDEDGGIQQQEVSNLEYVIGRRGSLQFLERNLRSEVLGPNFGESDNSATISGRSLRTKVEKNIEVTPNVFAIGSLTGDSLIRFAFGGCVYAAREIISRQGPNSMRSGNQVRESLKDNNNHNWKSRNNDYMKSNGHTDLGIDRSNSS